MAGIWLDSSDGWESLAPSGFPDEAALHKLVAGAPQVLPLAGSPHLVVLGSEVQLGSGYADIVGIEDSGRPVIIEVKLGHNAEARRAVVAQLLSYASYLQGLQLEEFDDVVAKQLSKAGHESIEAAVLAQDQEGRVDRSQFRAALRENLNSSRFRLVLVLDEAPEDLIRLVGYLESVTTDRLSVDLITVASYEVGGRTILLPQRVDPERIAASPDPERPPKIGRTPVSMAGAEPFQTSTQEAPAEAQEEFRTLISWARKLEEDGLARLSTVRGTTDRWTLNAKLQPANVGFVTIWNDGGRPYISLFRSVFEARAPAAMQRVEELIAPAELKQGNTVEHPSPALLDALVNAYREANGKTLEA